jgi:rhodanese-related sulfurtransferase
MIERPSPDMGERAKRSLIDVAGVRVLMKQRQVQFIDVREPALYALGHVAGSINLRPGEGGDFIRRRRTGVAVAPVFVVYCNCLEERASLGVVKEMTAAGAVEAFALKGGVRAWLTSGGPLVANRPTRAYR